MVLLGLIKPRVPKRKRQCGETQLWAQGVVGSNPIAPTNIPCSISKFWKQQPPDSQSWVRFGSNWQRFQFHYCRPSVFCQRMQVNLSGDLA